MYTFLNGLILIQILVINNIYIIDHVTSGVLLGLSILGRQLARKYHQPCGIFSINIILIPVFYFMAFRFKHLNINFSSAKRRFIYNINNI
jgi:hypothetical protein